MNKAVINVLLSCRLSPWSACWDLTNLRDFCNFFFFYTPQGNSCGENTFDLIQAPSNIKYPPLLLLIIFIHIHDLISLHPEIVRETHSYTLYLGKCSFNCILLEQSPSKFVTDLGHFALNVWILDSSEQLGTILIRNFPYCCYSSFGKGDLGALWKHREFEGLDSILFCSDRSSAELG